MTIKDYCLIILGIVISTIFIKLPFVLFPSGNLYLLSIIVIILSSVVWFTYIDLAHRIFHSIIDDIDLHGGFLLFYMVFIFICFFVLDFQKPSTRACIEIDRQLQNIAPVADKIDKKNKFQFILNNQQKKITFLSKETYYKRYAAQAGDGDLIMFEQVYPPDTNFEVFSLPAIGRIEETETKFRNFGGQAKYEKAKITAEVIFNTNINVAIYRGQFYMPAFTAGKGKDFRYFQNIKINVESQPFYFIVFNKKPDYESFKRKYLGWEQGAPIFISIIIYVLIYIDTILWLPFGREVSLKKLIWK